MTRFPLLPTLALRQPKPDPAVITTLPAEERRLLILAGCLGSVICFGLGGFAGGYAVNATYGCPACSVSVMEPAQ
jgi:hypothetical protein